MIRKLMEVSLSLVLCLALAVPLLAQGTYNTPAEYEKATGNKIESFSQASMLRTMVAAGEILPLEMRLPEEPLVVEPAEEIGRYGETLYLTMPEEPAGWSFSSYWLHEPPIQLTPDLSDLYPNWLESFKSSEDYKTWTLHLREGLRWSDGAPLAADDVMFWYEDIIKNEELFPVKPVALMHGGKLAEVEKVDEYTVKFHFAAPFPDFATGYLTLPEYMYNTGIIIRPKHYLMKYHIKYNPEAGELAKKEGFDHWYQLFDIKSAQWTAKPIGKPTIQPWVLKAIGPTHATFERNPYYWKVDTSGNQLPYIDRIEVKSLASPEAYLMSIMGGETDFALSDISMKDIPVLKKNEEKGGYELRLWKKMQGAAVNYFFYQDYEDPVMREILRDVRFRRAMSLAIKREEMKGLLFFGKGMPSQATVPPGSRYYVPESWQAYAQYDPEEANRLLDEIGLEWNKEHTFRLRPDGNPLSIKIQGAAWALAEGPLQAAAELVKGYWEVVGVKTDFEFPEHLVELFSAKKVAVTTHVFDMPPDFIYKGWLWPPISTEWWGPMAWYDAWIEGGRTAAEKEGVPENVIRFYELTEEFGGAVSEEEKIKIARKINLLWSETLWVIGTVGGDLPSPCVVKNYLRNVPQVGYVGYFNFQQIPTIPAQFFISK